MKTPDGFWSFGGGAEIEPVAQAHEVHVPGVQLDQQVRKALRRASKAVQTPRRRS